MGEPYHTPGGKGEGLRFAKLEGLGNDFIVVEEPGGAAPGLTLASRVALCDRHRGVGADGVLTLLAPRLEGAVVRMHVTNSDGSVPEMCGNGLRCVSRWLLDEGRVADGEEHVVDTDAGPRRAVARRVSGGEVQVEVSMGPARFEGVATGAPMLEEELSRGGERFLATAVSMGNPHLVLRGRADLELAQRLGPELVKHERFPHQVNVGFAEREGEGLRLIVYERGAGITQACGTGACAAAAAFVRSGLLPADQPVPVELLGGRLLITVPADGGEVRMQGPAARVFTGVLAVNV